MDCLGRTKGNLKCLPFFNGHFMYLEGWLWFAKWLQKWRL